MKKLIFILLLFVSFSAIGQTNRFPSIDSLKTYILKYVRNSTVESFTNLRLQNVVYGTAELLDSLTANGSGVDSIWITSSVTKDSIKYRKSGITYTAGTLDKASLKLSISDTASMLSPYLRSNVAAATYQPIGSYATTSQVTAVQSNLDTTRNGIRSDLNGKQGALTLTTTGSSGAATLVGNTLNIPQYSGGGGGASISDSTLKWAARNGNWTDTNVIIGSKNIRRNYTVKTAPYFDIATSAATFGTIEDVWAIQGIDDARYRVRQSGQVKQIKIYFESVPATLQNFYVTFWKAGTSYQLRCKVDILSRVTAGTNTIDVSGDSLFIDYGDYIGFNYQQSAGGTNFLTSNGVANSGRYSTTPPTDSITYTIPSSVFYQAIPIEVYMDAPNAIFIGDSKTAGDNDDRDSYATNNAATVKGRSYPSKTAEKLGMTFQNVGIGGQTSTQIQARFKADVTDKKPVYAFIEMGINDIATSGTAVTVISNYQKVLDSCAANGVRPVLLKILPWTNGTTAQNTKVDSVNAWIDANAATYNAIIADARQEVGQFRSGGPVGNYWDIVPAYTTDGVHFTAEAYNIIATEVANTINATSTILPSDVRKEASLNVSGRNQAFRIASTTKYLRDSLMTGFENGNMVFLEDSVQRLSIKTARGFEEVLTDKDFLTGTNAQRIAILNPKLGQTFYQTDYLVGEWRYNGTRWVYQINDFIIKRDFERVSSGTYQAPTTGTSVSGGTWNSWNAVITGMNMPVFMETGTAVNSGALTLNIAGANGVLPLENTIFRSVIRIPTLSTSSERFIIRWGVNQNYATNTEADGIYFRYCDSLNSGNFQIVTRSGGSENTTTQNSSIAVAANTTYELVIVYKSSSRVEFYVNGQLAGVSTTNIPTASRGLYYSIFKTGGTTANRVIFSGAELLKY